VHKQITIARDTKKDSKDIPFGKVCKTFQLSMEIEKKVHTTWTFKFVLELSNA
jgi:hypothetical protein